MILILPSQNLTGYPLIRFFTTFDHMKLWILPCLFLFCLTASGNTSPSYFQQEVNYKINVRLNDKKQSLHADIEIEYINRSSDTLNELFFHLWPNAYKNRNSALCKQLLESGDATLYFADEKERGFIDSLQFTADDEIISWKPDQVHEDICLLQLKKPLLPGNKVIIRTPFYVKLPSASFSRLGHLGQAYAITQWYPKPAVYDNQGWHAMPYLTLGEFYSEYGSFEVNITLPKNYVVGATGDLQTPSEIEWMNNKSKEQVISSTDKRFPPSDPQFKTIQFKQKNVHDFAWFADKRFHVQKSEVKLPNSDRTVNTWALYTNSEPEIWTKATDYINFAIYNYSKWLGDYPYNQCTVVDGTIAAGAGMEYPNITIVGKSGVKEILETVIIHEVGHNWFYGILGSNERIYPWMDEGINSYYESRSIMEKYPHDLFGNVNELSSLNFLGQLTGLDKLNYNAFSFFEYLLSASSHTDQPISRPAPVYTDLNYATIVYKKTAVAFYYLSKYLGDSLFDRCMQTYYEQWKFKHPQPEDIKSVFTSVSGKNLDWFFNELLFTTRQQDFKLTKHEKNKEGFKISVTDKSGLSAPFSLSTFKDDKPITETWYDPSALNKELFIPCNDCDQLKIDASGASLDVNHKNNSYRKRILPAFHLLPKVHRTDRSSLFITPIAGWNNYNEFLLGTVIYNSVIPFRNFEYYLAPLYGFGDKTINGNGLVKYSIYPEGSPFQEIRMSSNYRKFSYSEDTYRAASGNLETDLFAYQRFSPSLTFQFRKPHPRSSIQQAIKAEAVHLWEETVKYNLEASPVFAKKSTLYSDFYRLNYSYKDRRAVDPWNFVLQTEANKNVFKAEMELNYRISYKVKGRGADIRVFGGYTFDDKVNGANGFFLSDRNGVRGSNDYAYDEWYFGRTETEGFLFQQMALRQGAFKVYTPFGAYRSWIFAVNLQAELPMPLPIRFYADIGTTENLKSDLKKVYDLNASFSYNAGICFSLAKNVIDVYFPLLLSEEIKKYQDANKIKYKEQIRFVFNIARLNPLNIRNQLLR